MLHGECTGNGHRLTRSTVHTHRERPVISYASSVVQPKVLHTVSQQPLSHWASDCGSSCILSLWFTDAFSTLGSNHPHHSRLLKIIAHTIHNSYSGPWRLPFHNAHLGQHGLFCYYHCYFFVFLFIVLGIEPRTSCRLGKYSATKLCSKPMCFNLYLVPKLSFERHMYMT